MKFFVNRWKLLRYAQNCPAFPVHWVKLWCWLLLEAVLIAPAWGQTQMLTPPEAGPQLLYDWQQVYLGRLNGETKLLYTRSFERSQLAFADTDGDKDDDLYVGKADGHLAFFENIGTNLRPAYELRTEDFQAWKLEADAHNQVHRTKQDIDVGGNAAPTFVDIDHDGDLDLFIGGKDGTIFFYENRGNSLLPVFELATPTYMNIRPGRNSVPRFLDVNSDRAPDLLVGTHNGDVVLYLNAGVHTRAIFCGESPEGRMGQAAICPEPVRKITSIQPEVDASPAFVDWNHDGLPDLVIGKASGRLAFYVNRGDLLKPKWELVSDRFLFVDAGGYAAPIFYDLNRDGFPELLLGTASSNVVYYENREVLQTALKPLKNLSDWLKEVDWRASPATILESACAALGGPALCLPILKEAFNLPNETPKELNAYIPLILNPHGGASKPAEAAPASGPATEGTPPATNGAAAPEAPPAGGTATPQQQANAEAQARLNRLRPPLLPAQANAPAPGANAPAPTPATTAQEMEVNNPAKGIPTRNHFWLGSRNFLNFAHLLAGEKLSTITTGDWDSDGDLDLLLGSASGRLFAYENAGTTKNPNWFPRQEPIFASNQRTKSAPILADIDGDGDLDVLIGNETGRLELLRNRGTKTHPQWEQEDVVFAGVDVGSDSRPALIDVDRDGDLDLFVGNSKGSVVFYLNEGTSQEPKFVLKSTRFARITVEQEASPSFFDWGDDQQWDLILGQRNGQLSLVSHTPLAGAPITRGWKLEDSAWSQIKTISFSAPHFADMNGDQKLDLWLGDRDGNVLLYLNQGFKKLEPAPVAAPVAINSLDPGEGKEGPEMEVEPATGTEDSAEALAQEKADLPFDPLYTLVTDALSGAPIGRRAVPAFFDLDHDGDLDLFVGTKEGLFLHYMNEGSATEPKWTLVTKNFLEYQGGKNASPLFADLDGDGDLDLMIGTEKGSVEFWENRGTPEFAEFVANPTPFVGVTGGVNARPAVFDLDHDGRPDLLLGNFQGQLVQYLQVPGTGGGFRFQLERRKYLDLDVGFGASPTFADLNNTKQSSLVVGSDHGALTAFQAIAPDPAHPWGWQKEDKYFKGLKLPVGSFPAFVDLNGDQKMDLVLGSESGHIYFYRNEGQPSSAGAAEAPQAPSP